MLLIITIVWARHPTLIYTVCPAFQIEFKTPITTQTSQIHSVKNMRMHHPTQGGGEKVEDINNLQCVAQQISRAFYNAII